MSEQSEALTFGPQWIRDLSNGASVCVPPPSPGPKYKLAQYRYGKEDMLALFSDSFKPPNISELAEFILTKEIRQPLACIPMTEEEQRNSLGSLNSAAVLKMMGRGGQRGGRGMSRGGRGSGRGRGEGGFHRGFSADESLGKDDGWQRDAASRRLSWGENGRGVYGDRVSSREEHSPRGYDPSAPPGRHKEPSRALSSGNWRSSESGDGDDDGGGWIVSGRSEKWRSSSRNVWHSSGSRDDYSKGEQGSGDRYNDSWNQGRHDRSNSDDVPEWSRSDSVFEPDLGSFDSSGAFCVTKEKKEVNDTGQKEPSIDKDQKEDWDKELNDESQNSSERKNGEVDQHHQEKVVAGEEITGKKEERQKDPQQSMKGIQQQANVQQNKVTAQQSENRMNSAPVREVKASEVKPQHVSVPAQKDVSTVSTSSLNSHDEIGADLERVAESCIANLDVEGEDQADRHACTNSVENASVAERMRSSPIEEQTKWYYRDPQGQEQGPFTNDEMVEWFHHGYFTMQLSIRRHCDVVYLPLGEVIKRWQRVPFLPGPSPPPITHQHLMTQQTMMMQQQLLQQHYQQLQKQAILQQIQQQQQQQQEQQRHHPDPAHHLPMNTSSINSSVRPLLLSPHSLPVSHAGAAETIWGPEPEATKGPWSPVSSNASVWEQQNRRKSPVPSAEEAKRLEEEKEKAEAEKRETELLALKRKEEEKRQLMLKKQEEEALQREALQRENELRLKKQKEEEEEEIRREKERRRLEIQKQAEAEKRKQEASRQKKEAQQEQKQKKENGEQKQQKQNEMREQQKQALLRLQQQQQELQRREQQRQEKQRQEQQQRLEQEKQVRQEQQILEHAKRQEEMNAQQLQQQLQQKRMQSNSSSRWGSQNATALSLSEIQEQEEKNRRAHEEKMRELEAKQRQLQSAATGLGWADRQNNSSTMKSLKAIQDEQARQQRSRQNEKAQRTQPAQVSSSGAWSNSWAAGNNNVWAGTANDEQPDQPDDKDTGFWAEAGRAVSRVGKSQPQTQKTNASQTRVSSSQPVTTGKKSGKKVTKEEESVRRIFQETVTNDPFTEWCTQSLFGLDTSVDVPTFVNFLKEVESPYEIHDYVRDFLGDSSQAQSFAKEFIERKRAAEKRVSAAAKSTSTTCKAAPTVADVVPRGGGGANRLPPPNATESKDNVPTNGKNKKKKKQRMQKVDPSILGFSVNAAERVNMGEIQSVDDS